MSSIYDAHSFFFDKDMQNKLKGEKTAFLFGDGGARTVINVSKH